MNLAQASHQNTKEQETEGTLPENLQSLFNQELLDQIISQKWEEKKEALNKIYQILESNSELSSNDINDIFDFLKLKLKKFKETNLFLLKDSLPLFSLIMNKVSNKSEICHQLIEGFYDKIGEAKLTQDIQKLFQSMININQEQFFNQIFNKLKHEKKIPVLKEFATFFEDTIRQNGLMKMNKDDIITYCVMLSNNPNPQIRANAMKVLCLLYQIIGAPLRKQINGIKESTKKLIEDAFNKIDGDNLDKYLVKSKSETSLIDSNELGLTQPLTNNSQKTIPPIRLEANDYQQLFKAIDTGKWSEKKQALETLESALSQAFFEQKQFPLDEFFFLIKDKLRDKNQKLVLGILSLLADTIEILKSNFKPYCDVVALPLINNLNDNKEQVRNSVIMCLEKWIQNIGCESILTYLLNALQIEKYDLRLEILKFVNQFKDKIISTIGSLINPLLICLQDKSNVIRNITEDIIKWTFDNGLNITHYNDHLTQFKPAIAEKVKSLLGNCYSLNKSDKFNTIDNSSSNNNSNLLGCMSNKEINPMLLNTNSSQNTFQNNSSKTLKIESASSSSPKKSKALTSRDVSPSSNEKIYNTELNFVKLKKIRNSIDKKLKLNYDSLREDKTEDEDEEDRLNYLAVFLSDSFIKKYIYSKPFIEIIKVFIALIQKESFKQFYFPNYDLTVKYIIKQLSLINDKSQDVIIQQCVEQYFKIFLSQITLNDLQLDYIESKLALELLLNIIDNKNGLIKKYIEYISIDQSFEFILEYGIATNAKIKTNILELYNDILTNGKMQSIDLNNFKMLIKYLYSAESIIRLKATQLFNTIESIIGILQWRKLLNQLDTNEQDILNNNMQKKQEESNMKTDKTNSNKNKETRVEANHQQQPQPQPRPLQINKQQPKEKLANKKEIIDLLTQINETERISSKLENTNRLISYFINISSLTSEQNNILMSLIDTSIQTILYEIESFFDPNDIGSPEVQSYLTALLSLFQTIVISKENVAKMAEDTLSNSFIALFNFLQMDQEPTIAKSNLALLNTMNNIVLKMIENSNITLVIIVLLDIAEKYKEENMTGVLAVNCLLNLHGYIGSLINQILVGAVLNKMNEILSNYDRGDLNDALVVKVIKKLLFEFIKHRKNEIIDDYDNSISNDGITDKYLFDWIDKCLEQLSKQIKNNKSGIEGNNMGNNKGKSNKACSKRKDYD